MERKIFTTTEAKQHSPLTLAFLGDAVYEIMVRARLVSAGDMPVKKLHTNAVAKVKATFQAEVAKQAENILNEDEADILRRGRNASTATVPKGASTAQYHLATGLEALCGYLYLTGNDKKLNEIIDIAWNLENSST